MKKVFSILAIAAMFAFASCGSEGGDADAVAAQALKDSLEADSILKASEEDLPVVDTTAAAPVDTTATTPAEDAEVNTDGGDTEG